MKNWLPLLLLVFLFSCQEEKTEIKDSIPAKESIFSTSNLNQQRYTIDNSINQTILTDGGSIIKIPALAFEGNAGEVIILVKEAFSMEDIVLANLHTQADGGPLQSGGMIEIKTSDNSLKLIKKIEVHIPKKNYSADMSIYTGEKNKEGNIDWVNPNPILSRNEGISYNNGETLFQANCSSCHNTNKESTGPALTGVTSRRPKEWIYKFVRNSAALIASGDPYANCTFKHWNKTAMTAFPKLSNQEIDDIFYFIDEKSSETPMLTAAYSKPNECDSCETYTNLRRKIINETDSSLAIANSSFKKQKKIILANIANENAKRFNGTSVNKNFYYSFKMDKMGWRNIDVLIATIYKNEIFSIDIDIDQKYTSKQINLFVPELLINMRGSLDKKKGYWFGNNLKIPKNLKCFLILVAKEGDQMYFDVKEFYSKEKQSFTLAGKEIEKENITERIKALKLNEYELNVTAKKQIQEEKKLMAEMIENTTNANQNFNPPPTAVSRMYDDLNDLRNRSSKLSQEILKKNNIKLKQIEQLKPKGCDCCDDCIGIDCESISEINIGTGADSQDYE